MIFVTHGDAVAALAALLCPSLGRVRKVGYCGLLLAARDVKQPDRTKVHAQLSDSALEVLRFSAF